MNDPQPRSYKVPWFFSQGGTFYVEAFDADQAMALARDELSSGARRANWEDDAGDLQVHSAEEDNP